MMKRLLKFVNSVIAKFNIEFIYFHNHRISYQFLQYSYIKYFLLPRKKKLSFIIYSNNFANSYLHDYQLDFFKKNKYYLLKSNFLSKIIVKLIDKYELSCFIKSDSLTNSYFHKRDKKEFLFDIKIDNTSEDFKRFINKDFICFMTRDEAYLKKQFPKIDWTYHSYRNSDPNIMYKCIQNLINQNINCLRAGTIYEHDFEFKSENYLDYADMYRTPKFDFLISRLCKLFICDTSGIIYFPLSQQSNILRYNCNIFDLFKPFNNTISIPILYKNKSTNKYIPFNQCIKNKIYLLNTTNLINNSNIEVEFNSSKIITKAALESIDYGCNFINNDHKILNNQFYRVFDDIDYIAFHNSRQRYSLDDKCILPYSFLKEYRYLYEDI